MPRQSELRFTFTPASNQAAFDVYDFTRMEGLSQPFQLTPNLSSNDHDIDSSGLPDGVA